MSMLVFAPGQATSAHPSMLQVDFLKRAELREYEKERDQKLSADVRNRGRL